MTAYSGRSFGYKLGVAALYPLSTVFLIGFYAPYWHREVKHTVYRSVASLIIGFHKAREERHWGLWTVCDSSNLGMWICASRGFQDLPAWLHVARLLGSLAQGLLLLAGLYGLAANCCRLAPGPHSRTLEIATGAGGLLGFIGVVVFLGNFVEVVKFSLTKSFGWAFYFATVGSVGCVIDSIIIAISNKPISIPSQTGQRCAATLTEKPEVADNFQSNIVIKQGENLKAHRPVTGQVIPSQEPLQCKPPAQTSHPAKAYATVYPVSSVENNGIATVYPRYAYR